MAFASATSLPLKAEEISGSPRRASMVLKRMFWLFQPIELKASTKAPAVSPVVVVAMTVASRPELITASTSTSPAPTVEPVMAAVASASTRFVAAMTLTASTVPGAVEAATGGVDVGEQVGDQLGIQDGPHRQGATGADGGAVTRRGAARAHVVVDDEHADGTRAGAQHVEATERRDPGRSVSSPPTSVAGSILLPQGAGVVDGPEVGGEGGHADVLVDATARAAVRRRWRRVVPGRPSRGCAIPEAVVYA